MNSSLPPPYRPATLLRVAALALGLSAAAHAADKPGAKDFASISRFAGSEIVDYQASDFDAALLPSQPMSDPPAPGGLLKVEGRVTSISYRMPKEKSTLEVMRSYQQALGSSYKVLFKCAGVDCGSGLAGYIGNSGKVIPSGWGATFDVDKNRYVLARRTEGGNDTYVLLYAMQETNYPATLFQKTVEVVPMAGGQVSVLDAGALKRGLDHEGKVAIYGVYFDTAKADVKSESKPSLDEMAKLLASDPALKVYVVGHTDNAGSLVANLELSQRRAESVAKALASSYKIDPQRMAARGVASLAPVASNANETGRARNRRVELVVQ